MNERDDDDDPFVDQVVAWDEAIADGRTPLLNEGMGEPNGQDTRLAKSIRCLEMLRRLNSKTPLAVFGPPNFDGPSDTDPIEPRFFGRFLVKGEIGRGGYGVVFLAHDPQLNRDIAIKVPHVSIVSVPGLRARFNQEARAAAGLDHPNIVQVFEAGDIGPICFIASAYCPGPNLADWLAKRKELVPYSDAAHLMAILADAVSHAHHRGVFHRDIKPANIILFPEPKASHSARLSDFTPRITDFGLAKVVNDSSLNTQSGSILGTPSFMAPEQAAGKANTVNATADVYSLGAILYQLLTGVAPFQGDSPLETLQHVMTREPIAPSRLRQSIPKDLETICLKCLEKVPKERFHSAAELADDLQRYLRSEPIHARPISSLEWLWRMARRKPLATSLTAALVFSIIVGLLSVSILWQRSEYQRGRVTQALDKVSRANIEVMQRNEHSARMLYLRDIASAKAESAHNVEHSIQILENCQSELRKWEWNYLNQVCGADMFTMLGQSIPAWNCKFTKDGKRIVIGCGMWNERVPGEILAWDFESGQLARTIQDFEGGVMDIAVHPNGRWIAAAEIAWGTDNGGIQIVDLETGAHLRKLRECVTPFGVAYSPDGRYLMGADFNGQIALYDSESMELISKLTGHQGNAYCVAMHPDNSMIASGGRDGAVHVWDRKTGANLYSLRGYGRPEILKTESRIAKHQHDFKSWANSQREIAENHEKHPYASLFYLKNEVETNDNRLQLSLRRGHAYAELDDWIHAEQEFARAIDLDATDSIVHVYRLICIQHQADLQRFLGAFDQMRFEFQHSRNSSDINNLAWAACLIDEPLSERTALIEDLKRMLDYPMAKAMRYNLLNTLGTLQLRVGAWKEAKESIEKGVAVRGTSNTMDDILLAMLEYQLDDHDSAKRRLLAIETQGETLEREIKKGLPPSVHWADRSVEQLLLQQAIQTMSLEPIRNSR